MAGLLGVETSFAKRRMTLGYREARIASNCALGAEGAVLRGHEFHYATIVATGERRALRLCPRRLWLAPKRPPAREEAASPARSST